MEVDGTTGNDPSLAASLDSTPKAPLRHAALIFLRKQSYLIESDPIKSYVM